MEIKLSNSMVTLVDDENYKKFSSVRWYYLTGGYAACSLWNRQKHKYCFNLMHRIILKAKPGQEVDHIDGNGLNNQRSNLRLCSRKTNSLNRRKTRFPASSKYKGVHLYKKTRRWQAKIQLNREVVHLGYFITEEAAACAYNKAALRLHKDFAKLN